MLKKVILLIIFLTNFIFSQDEIDNDSTNVNITKPSIIGGVTTGAFVLGYGLQNNMWWKGEKSAFHFNWENDWKYSLGADKIGHFYFGYLVSNIYRDVFIWSGIKKNRAATYSGIFTFSYQTFLEIRDGFSKKYGFSWGDFTANFLGSFFMIMKTRYNFLKSFDVKISFYPSQKFKNGSNKYIIDDYESTYHWLSLNINDFLSEDFTKFYPSFINIAIGHGVKKIDEPNGSHELYISLDWNLDFIKTDNWLINILKYLNKYYHLPAPTIKIYPNVVWYGIKF